MVHFLLSVGHSWGVAVVGDDDKVMLNPQNVH